MRIALLVGALLFTKLSCNQTTLDPETTEFNQKEVFAMKNDISLKVEFNIDKGLLLMNYEIHNMNTSSIYLMNHLFQADKTGAITPDRNLVYIYPEEQKSVHLAKWVPPIPEDLFADEIRPYATLLFPGEKFSEEIKLKIPLKPFVPYRESEYHVETSDISTYEYIYFTIGFYFQTKAIQPFSKKIGGVDVLAIGGIPAFGEGQQRIEIEKVRLPIPVLLPRK